MDPTLWVPTGGTAALLAIGVGVVMKVMSLYSDQVKATADSTKQLRKETEAEIAELKRALREEQARVATLIWMMQRAGLQVPATIFGVPDDKAAE